MYTMHTCIYISPLYNVQTHELTKRTLDVMKLKMAKADTDDVYEEHFTKGKDLLSKFDSHSSSAKHWISTVRVKKPKVVKEEVPPTAD